jgi:hypothetical protein
VRRVSALLLFAFASACSTGAPLSTKAIQATPAGPPSPFVDAVKARWSGARVAALDAPCANGTETPAYITGDFDGDGATDVAAPVRRSDGVHLVAGLLHTYGYAVMDVVPSIAGSTLSVRPRGMRYGLPGSIVDYYFSADTIVVSPCDGTPTAHIWNGTSFQAQPLAK